MKAATRTVFVNGKELAYTFINNNGEQICFMLSGKGYTYDKPLLYYSTMMLLENDYDIVHIHYRYGENIFKQDAADIGELMNKDIQAVMEDVDALTAYAYYTFLGKSLGTIPIVMELMRYKRHPQARIILLTPLLSFDEIFQSLLLSKQEALIIIGNHDHHYDSGKIQKLMELNNFHIHVFQDTNHSLEPMPFNTIDSLQVMEKTMLALQSFLLGESKNVETGNH